MVNHVAGYHNVDPAIFLDMTIVDMHVYISGLSDRKQQEIEYQMRSQDVLNHILGRYIYFATHEPNKYPKKPIIGEKEEEKVIPDSTPEQIALALKAWMGVLGGKEVTNE